VRVLRDYKTELMRDINASGYQYNEFRDFSTSPFDVLKEILVEDSQLNIYVCVC